MFILKTMPIELYLFPNNNNIYIGQTCMMNNIMRITGNNIIIYYVNYITPLSFIGKRI